MIYSKSSGVQRLIRNNQKKLSLDYLRGELLPLISAGSSCQIACQNIPLFIHLGESSHAPPIEAVLKTLQTAENNRTAEVVREVF